MTKKITIQFVYTGKGWGMFKLDPLVNDCADSEDLLGTGNAAGIGEDVEELLRKLEADNERNV